MHPHTENEERAVNLSVLNVSRPGEFSRVESNNATDPTPGGALSSIPLSFSLATVLSPRPINILRNGHAPRFFSARRVFRRDLSRYTFSDEKTKADNTIDRHPGCNLEDASTGNRRVNTGARAVREGPRE